MDLERSVFAMEFRAEGGDGEKLPTLTGYSALFNSRSEDLGGFYEEIAPGAFSRSLKKPDVHSFFNHDPNFILGHTSRNLTLTEDEKGLAYRLEPVDTHEYRRVAQLVKLGLLRHQSFAFRVVSDEWRTDGRHQVRTIKDVDLFEAGPVAMPAYRKTSVQARSALRAAGIDWDALNAVIMRGQAGITLTPSDHDLLTVSIEVLSRHLPPPAEERLSAVQAQPDDQRRLIVLAARRLALAEADLA